MTRDEVLRAIGEISERIEIARRIMLTDTNTKLEDVAGPFTDIEGIVSFALDDYERSQAQKENEENGQTQATDSPDSGHAQ